MVFLLTCCALVFSIDRPMSEWNIEALDSLKVKLKLRLSMSAGLRDILPIAAGGFMSELEVQQVTNLRSDNEQIEKVIEELKRKHDEDFETFLGMLRRTNQGVWADELERKAKELREERKCVQSACVAEGWAHILNYLHNEIYCQHKFCVYLVITSNLPHVSNIS